MIAALIHVDGVEFHRNTEFIVFSWSSLFAGGDVKDIKLLICAIPAWMCPSNEIFNIVYEELCKFIGWSFRITRHNRGPDLGFYDEPLTGYMRELIGQVLAGGWLATFAGCKTDGKQRASLSRYQRKASSTFICVFDLASNPFPLARRDLVFCDFTPSAGWRKTLISHEEYMATERVLSPMRHIDGWRIDLNYADRLHTKYLGFDRDVAACVIVELVREGRYGAAPRVKADYQDQLDACSLHCWNWLKNHGGCSSKIRFTLANLGIGDSVNEYPELGSIFKAMVVKRIMYYLTAMAREWNSGSKHDELRECMMWGQHTFDYYIDHGGLILSWSDALHAVRGGRLFLLCFQELGVENERAREHDESRHYLYKPRPKLHDFDHTLDFILATRINVKFLDTLLDESFMGVCKKIGARTRGAGPSIMQRTLQRYLLGLAIRFDTRRARMQDEEG